ncbi:AaceriAAR108WAp [[Ashbya] aceris (nom. inval.)]|nr:AaceriAAR108WAp [[Ashbya] aceris (nom. inval.)]
MGQAYNIFGRPVQPHVLVLGTLFTLFGGVTLYKARGRASQQPAAVAPAKSTSEEIDFEQLLGEMLKEEKN